MTKVHGLEWWAKKLYQMSYIELTDEQAANVFDQRWEAEENGASGESESVASDSGSPSKSVAK
jgi:hypothetical protein